MPDVVAAFRSVMQAEGLQPPEHIEPGKIHRFPGVGKQGSNRAGWCKLFDDYQGGCFGDWSSGLSESWHVQRDQPMSQDERAEFTCKLDAARRQADMERMAHQFNASERSVRIWEDATVATDSHP